MGDIDRAVEAIGRGDPVVYPTDTVYGLGADATAVPALETVYDVKGRDLSNPVSMAVASISEAEYYVEFSDRTRRFVAEHLPGPVTVLCPPRGSVPAALRGDRGRVGLRIPDCELALAFLERLSVPITATSANVSGEPNARSVAALDPRIQQACTVVLDGGELPGGESTVVDVDRDKVIRNGQTATAVAGWLERH